MPMKIAFKIYRVQDYDLYTLYCSKVFNFSKLVRDILTAYANKKKYYVNIPQGRIGNSVRKASKLVLVNLDENKDADAISLLSHIKPGMRTLFIKKILRQSLSDFDYFYYDEEYQTESRKSRSFSVKRNSSKKSVSSDVSGGYEKNDEFSEMPDKPKKKRGRPKKTAVATVPDMTSVSEEISSGSKPGDVLPQKVQIPESVDTYLVPERNEKPHSDVLVDNIPKDEKIYPINTKNEVERFLKKNAGEKKKTAVVPITEDVVEERPTECLNNNEHVQKYKADEIPDISDVHIPPSRPVTIPKDLGILAMRHEQDELPVSEGTPSLAALADGLMSGFDI